MQTVHAKIEATFDVRFKGNYRRVSGSEYWRGLSLPFSERFVEVQVLSPKRPLQEKLPEDVAKEPQITALPEPLPIPAPAPKPLLSGAAPKPQVRAAGFGIGASTSGIGPNARAGLLRQHLFRPPLGRNASTTIAATESPTATKPLATKPLATTFQTGSKEQIGGDIPTLPTADPLAALSTDAGSTDFEFNFTLADAAPKAKHVEPPGVQPEVLRRRGRNALGEAPEDIPLSPFPD